MHAKLIVALICALIAVPAFAGQPNGHDSVYATHAKSGALPASGAIMERSGRDSVYAIDTKPSTRISVAVNFRAGRP